MTDNWRDGLTDDDVRECVTCGERTATIHYRRYSVCHPCFFKAPLGYSLRVEGKAVRDDVAAALESR